MKLSRLKFMPNISKFKRKQKKVIFKISAPDANKICLVGDFNGWDDAISSMKKINDNEWETSIKLCSGRYEYKYIIDGEWKIDPKNNKQISNELGSTNSVINVTI